MAKFCGKIGFVTYQETAPGVTEEVPVEKKYYGDLLRHVKRYQSTDKLNDDVYISNEISIIANAFLKENFANIRYVELLGVKWSITNVDATNYPRMVLSLGGVYNG